MGRMSAFAFPFPVLVCDTGGTNVRFALSDKPGAPLGPIVHLVTDDYPGLPEAIEAAAPKLGQRPRSMIVCGAGPVVGRELKLTNAPWVMDGPETARRAGLSQGLLLNDFEAQALSLPAIKTDWTRAIGPLAFGAQGPEVILGPGTGLGIAALVEANGRFTPVSSEACHIDFGPVTEEEFAFWPYLERAHGRITSESVLNGAGLARVHRARMMALGRPDPHLEPPQVTAAALADPKGEVADERAALLADHGPLRRRHGGDLRRNRRRDPVRRRFAEGDRLPRRCDLPGGVRGQGAGRRAGAPHPDPAYRSLRRGARRHGGDRRGARPLWRRLCPARLGLTGRDRPGGIWTMAVLLPL